MGDSMMNTLFGSIVKTENRSDPNELPYSTILQQLSKKVETEKQTATATQIASDPMFENAGEIENGSDVKNEIFPSNSSFEKIVKSEPSAETDDNDDKSKDIFYNRSVKLEKFTDIDDDIASTNAKLENVVMKSEYLTEADNDNNNDTSDTIELQNIASSESFAGNEHSSSEILCLPLIDTVKTEIPFAVSASVKCTKESDHVNSDDNDDQNSNTGCFEFGSLPPCVSGSQVQAASVQSQQDANDEAQALTTESKETSNIVKITEPESHITWVQNWLRVNKSETRSIENIIPSELNDLLRDFFLKAHKPNGENYEPSSLDCLKASLEKHLCDHNYPHSIRSAKVFKTTRQAITARKLELKKFGLSKRRQACERIDPDEINKLIDEGLLGDSTPDALQFSLFFFFTKRFGFRSGFSHRNIKFGNIKLGKTVDGLEFITLVNWKSKTMDQPNSNDIQPSCLKIFAQPTSKLCPVQLYKLFCDKRPEIAKTPGSPFYLKPIPTDRLFQFPTNQWFYTSPMGPDPLKALVKIARTIAGIEGRNTKHALVESILCGPSDTGTYDEVQALIESQEHFAKGQKTKANISTIQNWLQVNKSESRSIESIIPSELNDLLSDFFVQVLKPDGENYNVATLDGMKASVERHLREHHYPESIITSSVFKKTRQAITDQKFDLNRERRVIKRRASERIGLDEERKLIDEGLLGDSTPDTLQFSLLFYISKCFGFYSRESHRNMEFGDIHLGKTVDGLEFITLVNRKSKTMDRPNSNDIQPSHLKIFAQPTAKLCPVQLYKLFCDKRPGVAMTSDYPFYLKPVPMEQLSTNDWFYPTPLARDTIGSLMKNAYRKAGIEGKTTNSSLVKYTMCQPPKTGINDREECDILPKDNLENEIDVDDTTHVGYYECPTCSERFPSRSHLAKHKLEHTRECPVKCGICGKLFRYKGYLARHMRVHTGEKPYQCNECGKCFSAKSQLKAHKRRHTGEKPFTCGICGHSFASQDGLTVHHRTHTGEKPYLCPSCGKRFSCNAILASHKRTHHTVDKSYQYQCAICKRPFMNKSSLGKHQRKHTLYTGEKQHPCNLCGKAFFTSSDLKGHKKRLHSGEKPFKCSICGASFTYQSYLTVHKRKHTTGEKRYLCHLCGKPFSQLHSLNRHYRIHTREKHI